MWGVSDAPTQHDSIGRQRLADAIAEQLRPPGADLGGDYGGPTVVSVEGPWGCGTSTLMNLIRQRLPSARRPSTQRPATRALTVRKVLRQIGRYEEGDDPPPPATPAREVVTAWFNPWGHQSGEQVWAGLAGEIIDAAAVVLYPTDRDREHYWFARNLRRVDRQALRRAIQRRTVSPILGLAIAAVVAPIAIAISDLNDPLQFFGRTLTPAAVGMGIAFASLLAGIGHTLVRRHWGKAVDYLPSELFQGPVVDGASINSGDEQADVTADPLRRARVGSLYLYQHNIGDIVDDLAAHGCDLVVFVDDIDRCRAETTAEVFEAINLFLANVASRSGLRARFVVGLDSSVVAAHLDALYSGHVGSTVAPIGDDPTPGWAFLRKLIQLPVAVPQVPDDGVECFVDAVMRHHGPATPEQPVAAPSRAGGTARAPRLPTQRRAADRAGAAASAVVEPATAAASPGPPPVETVTWRSLDRHPRVRSLAVNRLSAQPDRSIREGKRLLNVWQLYVRLLAETEPLNDPAASIQRARNLLLVAEIVTRWPALQRALNRSIGSRRGLQILAAAAPDDHTWTSSLATLGLGGQDTRQAVDNLRALLIEYDGVAVADLAKRLM